MKKNLCVSLASFAALRLTKKCVHMRKRLFFCLILLNLALCAEHEESLKRISAHLMIHDLQSACEEAFDALLKNPKAEELSLAYIKALSNAGHEKELIHQFQNYLASFPDSKKEREILEHVSWGIIEHASTSTSPMMRIYALLGAFFSQDAKGIQIIHKSLSDANSLLRAASLQLSSHLRDSKLQTEVICLLKNERNFFVRQEAIKSAGLMKNLGAKNDLEKIIANDQREHEERALAIQSLVFLMDDAKREEVVILSQSARGGFRELACQLILEMELKDDIDLILPFLKDHRREVRKAALETIGSLRIHTFRGKDILAEVVPMLQDIDPKVAITAAWVLLLNDQECGKKALFDFIDHKDKEVRLFATGAFVKSGKYGLAYMKEAFQKTRDPFVKMNLSIGLIGQQEFVESACNALYEALSTQKEPLMWEESGIFKYLAPGSNQLNESILNESAAINQLCRLEILNILSMMRYSKAEEAIKQFLQENTFGISAMASILLLSEGAESSVELVKHLLRDPNEKIRIQAALILSLFDSGSEGLLVLQDSYKTSSREMKERILEGIGRIGSSSSIPFLVECLNEPFQSLRVIAASSLLQVLYH